MPKHTGYTTKQVSSLTGQRRERCAIWADGHDVARLGEGKTAPFVWSIRDLESFRAHITAKIGEA